jgi:hypothetical protein
MLGWDLWKKGFDAWEDTTARLLESWLRSPLLLEPSGAVLSATMRVKAASDQAAAAFWSALGLPTKRDQERTLHALNQLETRLLDLEERLQTAETAAAPAPAPARKHKE